MFDWNGVVDWVRVASADRLFTPPASSLSVLSTLANAKNAGDAFALHTALAGDTFALAVLQVYIEEIGHGEEWDPAAKAFHNNCGPDIRRYCAPLDDGYAWCAALGGYACQTAAKRLGIPLRFKRSLGAKRLGENIAAAHRRIPAERWRSLEPGDFMILDRGPAGSGLGHFTCIESIDLDHAAAHTIEGNHGPKAARFVRYPDKERVAFCASLRV